MTTGNDRTRRRNHAPSGNNAAQGIGRRRDGGGKTAGWWLRLAATILFALLVTAGVAALAILAGSSWHARMVAESSITEMTAKCDALDDEARAEVLRQARAFNAALNDPSGAAGDDIWPYERQLLFDREPMMSFVEIPKVGARLPIYHGTTDAALMAGVGHYEQSALPVGGTDTHCVLMGHSGMHGATMFDRIGELEPGDVLVIWTLTEPYAYRITGCEVVEPTEVASLRAEEGRDLVTLVTCTPYGVNSHRLLVHAERCDYVQEEARMPVISVDMRGAALLAALAACAAVAALAIVFALVRRHRSKRKQRIRR